MLVIMDLNHSESLISKTETLHRHLGGYHVTISRTHHKFLIQGFIVARLPLNQMCDTVRTLCRLSADWWIWWGPSRSERNTSAHVHTHKTRLGPISISRNAPTELTKRVSTLQTSLPFLIIIYRFCLAP